MTLSWNYSGNSSPGLLDYKGEFGFIATAKTLLPEMSLTILPAVGCHAAGQRPNASKQGEDVFRPAAML